MMKWIGTIKNNIKEAKGFLKKRRSDFKHEVEFSKKDEVLFTDEEQAYRYQNKFARSGSVVDPKENDLEIGQRPKGKTMGSKADFRFSSSFKTGGGPEKDVSVSSSSGVTSFEVTEGGNGAKPGGGGKESCWSSFLRKIGAKKNDGVQQQKAV